MMLKDYDLVIIGDTPAGRYAAVRAIHLKIRVALVEQPFEGRKNREEASFRQGLSYLSHSAKHHQRLKTWGIIKNDVEINAFANSVLPWWHYPFEEISLSQLGEMGVDIILASGQFKQKSNPIFITETRSLSSSAYLITTGSRYQIPEFQGLKDVGYFRLEDLPKNLTQLPQNLTILSQSNVGVELAQCLQQLGKKIQLITDQPDLLGQEEREINRYLLAHLEAEGIHVFLNSHVTHIKRIEDKIWLQIDNQGIVTDGIIVISSSQPNIQNLNLEEIGINFDQKRIKVNQKLQTHCSNVYAVGSVIGGEIEGHITQAEIDIALKNILGFALFKMDYRFIPYVVLTDPTFARVGFTEKQAKQQYQAKISVVEKNFQSLPSAQLLGVTEGRIKLIVHQNGQILGAHLLGYHAEEYMGAIALAMKQKIPLQNLMHKGFPSEGFAYILSQLALQWQQQRLIKYRKFPQWIQAWFI